MIPFGLWPLIPFGAVGVILVIVFIYDGIITLRSKIQAWRIDREFEREFGYPDEQQI